MYAWPAQGLERLAEIAIADALAPTASGERSTITGIKSCTSPPPAAAASR